MKRLIGVILLLVMIFSIIPGNALAETSQENVNLALGASLSYSGKLTFGEGLPVENAINGKVSGNPLALSKNESGLPYLVLDLGAPREIFKIVIYSRPSHTDLANFSAVLEVSNDINFENPHVVSDSLIGDMGKVEEFEISGNEKYQYVRINSKSNILCFAEIEVYGNIETGKNLISNGWTKVTSYGTAYNENYTAENIVDADSSTDAYLVGTTDNKPHIVLDLGIPTQISKINLIPRNSTNDWDFDIGIYVANEEDFSDGKKIVSSVETAEKGEIVSRVVLDIGKYRYIKLLSNEKHLRLKDIEVFGFWTEPYVYVSASGNDISGDGSVSKPFKTIQKGADAARALCGALGIDVTVNIASGEYAVDETVILDETHSGGDGQKIIFRGEDANNPPVISGGRKVSGWEKHNDFVWKAPLDYDGQLRNLYVNEYAATRAKSKYNYINTGFYDDPDTQYTKDGFFVSRKNFPVNLEKPDELEFCWDGVWAMQRTPVKDIVYNYDKYNHLVVMEQPYFDIACIEQGGTDCSIDTDEVFYIENAMALLDEPGEFYYDESNDVVYYYPRPGENMEEAETYVAVTEQLLSVEGNEDTVKNIVFENLSFKYGAWREPGTTGTFTIQAGDKRNLKELDENGKPMDTMFPFQIVVNNADNINFKNCEFACFESDALGMVDGVTNSSVTGCVFRDMSSGALTIGSFDHNKTNTGYKHCENISVNNNVIRRIGCEYPDAVGIALYYEKNIDITHNDIYDVPYTAISAGWGWGTKNEPDGWGGYNISFNKVGNVMNTMNDGAAIYVLGNMHNSKNDESSEEFGCYVRCNYIYDVGQNTEIVGNALYTDQGAKNICLTSNVLDITVLEFAKFNWWFSHGANKGVTETQITDAQGNVTATEYTYDNVYAGGNYTTHASFGASGYTSEKALEEIASVESTTTILDASDKDSWCDEAKAIVANAGLESEYIHLLSKAQKPSENPSRFNDIGFDNFYVPQEPVIVQAENWSSYYDLTTRDDNKPKLSASLKAGGVKMIENTQKGEWLEYTFEVPKDGDYDFYILAGIGPTGEGLVDAEASIYIDNSWSEKAVTIKATPTWTVEYNKGPSGIHLTKGEHKFKYYFKSGHYLDMFVLVDTSKDLDVLKTGNDTSFDEGVIKFFDVSLNVGANTYVAVLPVLSTMSSKDRVITALYNEDNLAYSEHQLFTGSDLSFSTDKAFDSGKIMMWDFTTLTPRIKAIPIETK